jgi:hypothetical protein
MAVACPSATSAFGQTHFGRAQLGDVRRTRSLVDLADRLHRHPQGSLPMKFRDPNALRRCYDLMNTDAVTHAAVLRPHAEHTAGLLLEQRTRPADHVESGRSANGDSPLITGNPQADTSPCWFDGCLPG